MDEALGVEGAEGGQGLAHHEAHPPLHRARGALRAAEAAAEEAEEVPAPADLSPSATLGFDTVPNRRYFSDRTTVAIFDIPLAQRLAAAAARPDFSTFQNFLVAQSPGIC